MDIGGINRIKPALASLFTMNSQKAKTDERDANGNLGYQKHETPKHLSPAQEDEALLKLNNLPAFSRSGLRAEIVRGEGIVTHIVVKDSQGHIVRNLPYEQIVEVYLNRNNEFSSSGRLLNKAA